MYLKMTVSLSYIGGIKLYRKNPRPATIFERKYIEDNYQKVKENIAKYEAKLQKEYNIPLLPDFVQHELSISGTTMYVPQDYVEMIDLMGKKKIKTDGMVSQHISLEEVPKMLDDIVNRRVATYKVIIDVND